LQATSVLDLQDGSTPTVGAAVGEGVQAGASTDLEGNFAINIGAGGGFTTTANADYSKVTILSCHK